MTEIHGPHTSPCRSCKYLKYEPAKSYLDKGHWHCTKKCSHIYPCPIGREKEETK